MITVLIVVASFLGAMLVFAHFGRYWVKTKIIPRLVHEGFCETCLVRSLRGENPGERPITLRAEAAYGLGYLVISVFGGQAIDLLLSEFKRQVRSDPDLVHIRRMEHPNCFRGRCACGTPHCDGHT